MFNSVSNLPLITSKNLQPLVILDSCKKRKTPALAKTFWFFKQQCGYFTYIFIINLSDAFLYFSTATDKTFLQYSHYIVF